MDCHREPAVAFKNHRIGGMKDVGAYLVRPEVDVAAMGMTDMGKHVLDLEPTEPVGEEAGEGKVEVKDVGLPLDLDDSARLVDAGP